MNALDKLRIILPHWIEHNHGHGREFAEWAAQLQSAGQPEIADLLHQAGHYLREAEKVLQQALDRAGGPRESNHQGGHDHHHH